MDTLEAIRKTKAALDEVYKRPCECVRCSDCGGSGNVWRDDIYSCDGQELERCDMCDGGIKETCDRCMEAIELDEQIIEMTERLERQGEFRVKAGL